MQRALLGVFIQELTPDFCESLNIKNTRGIYIKSYTNNDFAEHNGIKEGDIIQKIDKVNINTIPQLQEKLLQKNPGEYVNIDILREGKRVNLNVKLMNVDGGTEVIKKS